MVMTVKWQNNRQIKNFEELSIYNYESIKEYIIRAESLALDVENHGGIGITE